MLPYVTILIVCKYGNPLLIACNKGLKLVSYSAKPKLNSNLYISSVPTLS